MGSYDADRAASDEFIREVRERREAPRLSDNQLAEAAGYAQERMEKEARQRGTTLRGKAGRTRLPMQVAGARIAERDGRLIRQAIAGTELEGRAS